MHEFPVVNRTDLGWSIFFPQKNWSFELYGNLSITLLQIGNKNIGR